MLPVIAHRYGGRWSPERVSSRVLWTVDQEDQVRLTSSRSWLFSFQRALLLAAAGAVQATQKDTGAAPLQGRHRTREALKPQAFSALLLSSEIRLRIQHKETVSGRAV